MLPSKNRIKKKKDFEIIFKSSRSIKSTAQGVPLIFKTRKNNLELNRFGFVVSQKVSKKATVRNKVRRRLAEAVRTEMKNMPLGVQVKVGTDIVFIAMPGIETKKLFEIKENIKDILIKVKIKNV